MCFGLAAACAVLHFHGGLQSGSDHLQAFQLDFQPQLDRLIDQTREKYSVPAMFVAVAIDGKQLLLSCRGVTNLSDVGRPVRTTDQVMIGSVSKPVVSTLIGKLIEEHQLTWETKISDVFPNWGASYNTPCLQATIRQLLCHHGGLGEGNPHQHLEGSPTDWRMHYAQSLLSARRVGEPGEKYFYTAGPTIAALMAETVAKTSFESLLKSKLASPLKLSSLSFGKPWESADSAAVHGHIKKNGEVMPAPAGWNNYIKNDPSGGLCLSIQDLCAFGIAHAVGERSPGILRSSTFYTLHCEPYGDGALLGWSNDYDEVGWWTVATGSTGLGDHTILCVDPNSGVVIAIHANLHSQDGGQAATDSVVKQIKAWVQRYRVRAQYKPRRG